MPVVLVETHSCSDCIRQFSSSRALNVHRYREHGQYSSEIGEAMVQRIFSRLGRYDHKDVCRELANKRNEGRLLTNMPTEHEVIEMIGRAPWSTAIATVVDGTFSHSENGLHVLGPKRQREVRGLNNVLDRRVL